MGLHVAMNGTNSVWISLKVTRIAGKTEGVVTVGRGERGGRGGRRC